MNIDGFFDAGRLRVRLTVLAMLTIEAATTARAQDMPVPFENFAQDMFPSQVYTMNNARTLQRLHKHKKGGRASAGEVTTTYHASPTVTARAKAQYIAWAKKVAPTDAAKVEAGVRSMNVVHLWNQAVRENGLHSGDLTDVLTGYWMLNWAMANGKDADKPQTLAVRQQVRRALAANLAISRFSDAQKQELAETLMINYLYQFSAYASAVRQHDTQLKTRLADAAVTRFQNEMKINLRDLQLTDNGFIVRRG